MTKKRHAAFILAAALAAAALFGSPPPSSAEDFSFYGVRFGMTHEEISGKWLPLSEGTYAVPSPFVRNVVPAFDHEGRLYELSFKVSLPDDDLLASERRRGGGLVRADAGQPQA